MNAKSLLFAAAFMVCAASSAVAKDWKYDVVSPNPKEVVTSVSDFNTVNVVYPADWEVTVKEGSVATLVNDETHESINSTSMAMWDLGFQMEGRYYVQLNFPDLTANGNYTLTIPAGSLLHAGAENPAAIELKYTVNDPTLDTEEVPALELISASPEAGTAMASVGLPGDGRMYTFNTNINKYVGFATADWYDVTDPENPQWLCYADRNHELGSDAPIEILKVGDIPAMYKDHQYEIRVTCYNAYQQPRKERGSFTVKYTGTAEEYVYSGIKAVSVDPNPDTFVIESVEEGHFTVSFDAPVEIDMEQSVVSLGQMGSVPYESVVANDTKTEWTFTFPASQLESSSVSGFVVAKDAEGRTVRGNEDMAAFQSGYDAEAGFMFSYTVRIGGVELIVTPATGTVESLKTFTLKAPENKYDDMIPSWLEFPYLVKGRDIVYKFNFEDDSDFYTTEDYGTINLTLPEEQVEPGTYMLVIPYGTLICTTQSAQGTGDSNASMNIIYTIEGQSGEAEYVIEPKSIEPAAGDVKELSKFTVTFDEDMAIVTYDAYILDADGNELQKADITYDDDLSNVRDFHIALATPITEEGTYTLYIPQGAFGTEEYAQSNEDSRTGRAAKEIRAQYTVKAGSVAGINAADQRGDVYNAAGVLVLRDATAGQVAKLAKGFYIFNGKKVFVK